jgi:hypothetical protein
VSADEVRKEHQLWAKIVERRYPLLQYSSLSAVTGLLLIGPFYFHSLDSLLIFCGGWSNFVAFYAILRVFKETQENSVRAVLLVQSFFLVLILAFDLERWLGPKWILGMVFIPIGLMMLRIGRQVFRAKPVPGDGQRGPTTAQLQAAWDSILPSFFLLVCLLLVLYTEPFMPKLGTGLHMLLSTCTRLPIAFIGARDQAYLNLLLIPLLYLVCDLIMSRSSKIAKISLPLDTVIFAVGIACCACGLANFRYGTSQSAVDPLNALFESGAAAAVLLLGNWVFTIYIERLEPKTKSGTA